MRTSRAVLAALAVLVLRPSPAGAAAPRHGSLPAVSPDGRRIAFVSERDGGNSEVWVIDADGRNERRLTHTEAMEGAPDWTADGRSVVFRSSAGDSAFLDAIDPDGTHLRRLARVAGKTVTLAHDGRRIAWTSGTWTRNRLVVSAADGANAVAITDSAAGFFNVAWSPDDRRLAVTHRAPDGELQVWVMNADGSGARALTRVPREEGSPQWPAWSRDGRRLAVQCGRYSREDPARSVSDLLVIDVASGRVRNLTRNRPPVLDETPSWFPDGRRLAFQSDRTGAFEVWTMRAGGGHPIQLTGVAKP